MANNKVQLANGTVLIDLTDTTANAADVAQGKYFYTSAGVRTEGTSSGGGGGTSRLPSGYQEVEYLENVSGSGSYIDTGFTASNTSEICVKCTIFAFLCRTKLNSNGFGVTAQRYNNGNDWWRGEYATTTFPSNSTAVIDIDRTIPVIIDLNNNKEIVLYDNGECQSNYYSTTAKTFTTPHTMPLMAAYNAGAYDPRTCKLYYGLFYTNGTLVRHFIPCRRKADNEYGLYDLCGSICPITNTPFYVDAGNGSGFTVGGDVLGVLPIS